MRRAFLVVLGMQFLGLGACGDSGDEDNGGRPIGGDDGGMDAGKKPKKDAGEDGMDAGKDAGHKPIEAGIDGFLFVRDGSFGDAIIMGPTDGAVKCIFNKPAEWTCPDSFFDDGVCDCGCGALDGCDCNQFSCTEPGCSEPTCDACNAIDGTSAACEPAPDPKDWACSAPLRTDGLCDCGCGIADERCGGSGCDEASCYRPYCDRRWDDSQQQIMTAPTTAGWNTCPLGTYGAGDGCDCGCGIHDADCDPLLDCTSPGCSAPVCNTCHDATGRAVPCDAWVTAWIGSAGNSSQCNPTFYDDGVCDCGCGAADPDCATGGTTGGAGSFKAECQRCFNQANDQVGCNVPGAWTCYPQHYGTGDGCDCQCGAPDPDCNLNGCADPGCSATGGAACEYCWTDKDSPAQCGSGKWTCNSGDSASAWSTTSICDCGCGTPDPACRFGDRPGCTGPGCEETGCQMCNDAAGNRVACGGQWAANSCNLQYFGDGRCDCGCGAADPDCGDKGCTGKGCAAEGCEVCHLGSALIVCDDWHCDASKYDDADGTCDCGCGARDPDCLSGYGCKEPGCHRYIPNTTTETCDVCHDAFGRVVPCPT